VKPLILLTRVLMKSWEQNKYPRIRDSEPEASPRCRNCEPSFLPDNDLVLSVISHNWTTCCCITKITSAPENNEHNGLMSLFSQYMMLTCIESLPCQPRPTIQGISQKLDLTIGINTYHASEKDHVPERAPFNRNPSKHIIPQKKVPKIPRQVPPNIQIP